MAAYTKHKNDKRDTSNKLALMAKDGNNGCDPTLMMKVDMEKTQTWYNGYRLALLGLIVTSAAVGWLAAWAVGQDQVLTWVEDCVVAFAGSLIGGLVLDKYIIHPIADGSFFERVEDPIVQRFLQDGVTFTPVKDEKRKLFRWKKAAAPEQKPEPAPVEEAPAVDVESLTFDEKVKLIEKLKKTL